MCLTHGSEYRAALHVSPSFKWLQRFCRFEMIVDDFLEDLCVREMYCVVMCLYYVLQSNCESHHTISIS